MLARLASLWDWTPGTPATYLVPGATPTEARTRPPNLRLHQPLLRKGGVQACLPQSLQLPLLVFATIALGASAPLHHQCCVLQEPLPASPASHPDRLRQHAAFLLFHVDSRDSCASMQLQLSEAKIFSEPVKMFHALWLKASPCLSPPGTNSRSHIRPLRGKGASEARAGGPVLCWHWADQPGPQATSLRGNWQRDLHQQETRHHSEPTQNSPVDGSPGAQV